MPPIRSHETPTDTESEWDGQQAVADAPNDEDVLRYMHAWRDPDGEPDAKSTYSFPHHKPGDDTAANISAVNNALARLSQADIPADDRDGVERHLRKHREDAGLEDDGDGENMDDKVRHMRQRMRERTTPRNARWYDVRNQDGQTATLRIYDEIHWLFGVTPEDFARDLEAITAPEIEVQINSPGGDVFDGVAIYNALRSHPSRVTTRVDGIAASIASVIVQAGDRRTMLSGAQMMVHEAWGLAIGPAGEHREMADLLDKQTDVLAGIYAERSGRDAGEFRDMMTAETWLTAQETVDAGLADEVVNPSDQADEQLAARSGTRFSDELSEALDVLSRVTDGAERLDADCVAKGQELSQAKRDALDGIRQRLDALLDSSRQDEPGPDAVRREYARFVAISQGV